MSFDPYDRDFQSPIADRGAVRSSTDHLPSSATHQSTQAGLTFELCLMPLGPPTNAIHDGIVSHRFVNSHQTFVNISRRPFGRQLSDSVIRRLNTPGEIIWMLAGLPDLPLDRPASADSRISLACTEVLSTMPIRLARYPKRRPVCD